MPLSSVLMIVLLVGCGGGSGSTAGNGNGNGNGSGSSTFKVSTMDASGGQVTKFSLASGTVVSDDAWHFAYQKYVGFKTNSGTSAEGENNITVCLAKTYPALYDANGEAVEDEFMKLSLDNTLADFENVTSSDCNATQYLSDTIKTYIETSDWLDADYSQGAPIYSAKQDGSNGWIIRSAAKDANGNYVLARVKVDTVTVAFSPAPSRKVVLSSEIYNRTTSQFEAAVLSPELDFTSSKVYWDMETNTLVAATDSWELAISKVGQDYPIQVNAGVSGSGNAGVGVLQVEDAFAVTDPTSTAQVYTYFLDYANGAMSQPGDFGAFQYGADHKLSPTFAVYLFKDGDKYYKAQVVSNYGEIGTSASGNLVIRYAETK